MNVLADRSLEHIARSYSLDFIAIFGSTARDGFGRDVDIAVMPHEPIREFGARAELYEDLSNVFAPAVVDLAVLPNSSWLLSWQVARDGKAFIGKEAFERFRETAYWRRQDSHWWRQAERTHLRSFLKGEIAMDQELILRRLAQMTSYIRELERVLEHNIEEFEAETQLLRTAERDTELLVECAARINTEIGKSRGIPPSDYYSSFFALVPDWLSREVATELAAMARLRNLLIHQYEDVQPRHVYDAARASAPLWRRYIQAISDKL